MTIAAAVLDTNVVVSAVLDKPQSGQPFSCLALGLAGDFRLVVSELLLSEYRTVLVRPKFGQEPVDVEELIDGIRSNAELVEPSEIPAEAVSDPADLFVLATAVSAAAEYLVTGNTRHFPVAYADVVVHTPRAFLEALRRRG